MPGEPAWAFWWSTPGKGQAIPSKTIRTPWDYTLFGVEHEAPEPDATIPIVIARVPPDVNGNELWTMNGRTYNPGDVLRVLSSGRRYRLIFDNQSGDAHPLHLHRNTFELTKVNGKVTSGVRKDVVLVNAYNKVEVDFVPDQRGPTLLHCHNQFHMDRGFRRLLQIL
jgi:FtsP/CotA-like multicopper oxidase with cupredoxin domain